MAKELYLYSGIYSFVAERIIKELNDNMGSPVTLRANSGGGDVHAFWGIAAKMQEHGDVNYQVDAAAFSSAANLCFYAKSVTCLDVSNFVFHRADGYVSSPEDQAYLDKVNADLKKKMLAKVDSAEFKTITGHTVEEMFNPETRINIYLNASQMKKLGLVDKIIKLEPEQIEAFDNLMLKIAASHPEPVKTTDMTLEKLKAEFPAVYAAIMALGKEEGVKEEKVRVAAWIAFGAIDPVAVAKGIKENLHVDAAVISEMTVKGLNAIALKAVEKESPEGEEGGVRAEASIKVMTASEKEIAAFEANIMKVLDAGKGKKAVVADQPLKK